MRRLAIGLIACLLLLSVPSASAWDRVLGCAVDANGTPWGWGGTVTCQARDTGNVAGSGTLDTVGCFEIYISTLAQVVCTVNYSPGPFGDPLNNQCAVDADPNETPLPWDCGTFQTSTGPNAVSLIGFGAVGAPAGAAVISLMLIAGAAVVWRRRR